MMAQDDAAFLEHRKTMSNLTTVHNTRDADSVVAKSPRQPAPRTLKAATGRL
jgi:hypothetical protein